jgi:hypothetical protein
MLHIISDFDLSDKNKLVLNEFNTYYNSWIDSCINNLSFMEMQSKLLCLLQYVHNSIKKNNGLLQMCKLSPNIKLRYISDETTQILQIRGHENTESNDQEENATNDENYETLELGEMLINCITHYASVFEQSDFENLGGPTTRIIENTGKIEEIQKTLYDYKDLEAIFSE